MNTVLGLYSFSTRSSKGLYTCDLQNCNSTEVKTTQDFYYLADKYQYKPAFIVHVCSL